MPKAPSFNYDQVFPLGASIGRIRTEGGDMPIPFEPALALHGRDRKVGQPVILTIAGLCQLRRLHAELTHFLTRVDQAATAPDAPNGPAA